MFIEIKEANAVHQVNLNCIEKIVKSYYKGKCYYYE